MLEQKISSDFLNILKEELIPAMGCTEPIALLERHTRARHCSYRQGILVEFGQETATHLGKEEHTACKEQQHTADNYFCVPDYPRKRIGVAFEQPTVDPVLFLGACEIFIARKHHLAEHRGDGHRHN